MEPRPPALGTQSLSHWTTREAPCTERLKAVLDTEILSWSWSGESIHSPGTWEGGQGLKAPSFPHPADLCCSRFLAMVKQVEQLSLGIFHPAFMPIKTIRQDLQDSLPTDIHILASQRLGISLTHWPDGKNFIVTDFATRDEVIEVSRGLDAGPGSRWVSAISYPSDLQALSRADTSLGPWGAGSGSSRRWTSFCLLTRELSCTKGQPREYGSRACCSEASWLYMEGYGWGWGAKSGFFSQSPRWVCSSWKRGCLCTRNLVLQVPFDAAEKHRFSVMRQSLPQVGQQNDRQKSLSSGGSYSNL